MQARWGIELFVGVPEAEFEDEVAGGGVGGMMAGEESFCAELAEGKWDDGAGGFFGEAAAPEGTIQVNAKFEDAVLESIGAKAGATGVFVGSEKENRPVLDGLKKG
jgi:hypothetical protein